MSQPTDTDPRLRIREDAGQLIRNRLTTGRYTQTQLARKLEVEQSEISRLASGERKTFPASKLTALADALCLKLDQIAHE